MAFDCNILKWCNSNRIQLVKEFYRCSQRVGRFKVYVIDWHYHIPRSVIEILIYIRVCKELEKFCFSSPRKIKWLLILNTTIPEKKIVRTCPNSTPSTLGPHFYNYSHTDLKILIISIIKVYLLLHLTIKRLYSSHVSRKCNDIYNNAQSALQTPLR